MKNMSVYNSDDVVKLLRIEKSTAYKIIQKLNKELKELGCYTISGRVSKSYFDEKYHIKKSTKKK